MSKYGNHSFETGLLYVFGIVRAMMREKCTELALLDALIFLYRFGRDSRGRLRFRGVVLLNVGGGGGDSTPSLAGLITDRYRCQEKAQQAARR